MSIDPVRAQLQRKAQEQSLRLEWRKPSELADNPANWRRHPPAQMAALGAVMREVGWAGVLLYNERTQRLIDGHARKAQALKADETVPVLIGSWSEEAEKKILLTLDPIAAMADTDADTLKELLGAVSFGDAAVGPLLERIAGEDGWQAAGGSEPQSQEPASSEPGPEWPKLAAGQMWNLGPHQLMVGEGNFEPLRSAFVALVAAGIKPELEG